MTATQMDEAHVGHYRLLGITNSIRADSVNCWALHLVAELLPAAMGLKLHDLRALPFYDPELERQGWPQAVKDFATALLASDALVIASPEYNHSVPAVLKNAIDWMSRYRPEPLTDMPVMLISATPGLLGGARVQYDWRRILDAVGARPLVRPEVFIGAATRKFDSAGRCHDNGTRDMVTAQLMAFRKWVDRTREP